MNPESSQPTTLDSSSDHPSDTQSTGKPQFRRVLAGSMFGAVLEWYDFALFGVLAATVLGPAFFPGTDPTAKLLLSLATMGLGFVARPVGGLVFGHLGDKFGRKPMLVATFIILGFATAAIGLLPTYETWGIASTILLVCLRLIQGFALGGEFGAAVLLVSEYGTPQRRGFWAAWPQTGGPAGTILATLVMTVLTLILGLSAFTEWGWRIAFLLALPMLFLGWWVRKNVEETPAFREAKIKEEAENAALKRIKSNHGIRSVLKDYRAIIIGLGLRLGENVAFYVYTVFVASYAVQNLGYPQELVINLVTLAAVGQFIGMLLGGHWSDKVGRKLAMLLPSIGLLIWAPLFFILAQQHSALLLAVAVIVGASLHGLLAGPEAAWVAEMFPVHHRYTGVSMVIQGSSIIAGAPAPLISVWLANTVGWQGVMYYLMGTILVTLIAVLCGPETRGRDMSS